MLRDLYEYMYGIKGKDSFPKTFFFELIVPQSLSDNIDYRCNNYKLNNILDTDFECLSWDKKQETRIACEKIRAYYNADKNKTKLVKNIQENLKGKKDIIRCTEDLKEDCLNLIGDDAKNHTLIRASIIGCSDINTILYYMFRYSLVGNVTEKQSDARYKDYLKDADDYFATLFNNMIGSNINSYGVKHFLGMRTDSNKGVRSNTVAKFAVATNLLFGTGEIRKKNRKDALDYYEEIVQENDYMPLAHWGIGYIMLNYEDTYKQKHSDWNPRDKYIEIYKHARLAADLGCGAAYTLLGNLFNHMKEKKIDTSEIKEFRTNTSTTYFKQSKECGYYFALNNLGANALKAADLADSINRKKELTLQAYSYYLEMADEYLEPHACNKVGQFLIGEYGDYVETDRMKALEYWIKALTVDEYSSKLSRLKILEYFYNNYEDLTLTDEQKEIISSSYDYIVNLPESSFYQKHKDWRNKVISKCKLTA